MYAIVLIINYRLSRFFHREWGLVREIHPPVGESPVEWLLLTTLPIETLEDVWKLVEHYYGRWSIEVFFRTLKSGCRGGGMIRMISSFPQLVLIT